MGYTYREETPADITAIRRVEYEAFDRDGEARLVDLLREQDGILLSIVAEDENGEIVGHALFSPVSVEGTEEIYECAALGPIAVLPSHQGRGIGAELIEYGLARCHAQGYDVVFVLGDSNYYGRFGFEPTLPHDIRSQFDVPPEAFMLKLLKDDALKGIFGTVYYLPAFSELE